MNIRTEVIITKVNHYDMENNKGLSVRVVGNYEETNNSFGLSISEAAVPDYAELHYLTRFKKDLPATFKADFSMVSKKLPNGKEVPTVGLSNLEFVGKVQFSPVKETVPTK